MQLPSGRDISIKSYCNQCWCSTDVTRFAHLRMDGAVAIVTVTRPAPGWLRLDRLRELCPRCAAPLYLAACLGDTIRPTV